MHLLVQNLDNFQQNTIVVGPILSMFSSNFRMSKTNSNTRGKIMTHFYISNVFNIKGDLRALEDRELS